MTTEKKGRGAGPRPNRKKQKKQLSVRLDEDLLKVTVVRAEAEGLRVIDAIEDGLWLWCQRRPPTEAIRQVRFLATVLPLELQRLTLAFWDFYHDPKLTPREAMMRDFLIDLFRGQITRPEYGQGLQILSGEAAKEKEEGAASL